MNIQTSGHWHGASHTILLGGIGGDCHSVGLTILRQCLTAQGYRVCYLGIQNTLREFIRLCEFFDVVMVSSMDGHSRYYLAEFPRLVRKSAEDAPLWYLGGNLCIGNSTAIVKQYLEMGFDRVFAKFTDLQTVLQSLEQDLGVRPPKPGLVEIGSGAARTSQLDWKVAR